MACICACVYGACGWVGGCVCPPALNRTNIHQGSDMSGEGALRSAWNQALLQDVVAPLYAQLVQKMAALLTPPPPTEGGGAAAAAARPPLRWYYSLFPVPEATQKCVFVFVCVCLVLWLRSTPTHPPIHLPRHPPTHPLINLPTHTHTPPPPGTLPSSGRASTSSPPRAPSSGRRGGPGRPPRRRCWWT